MDFLPIEKDGKKVYAGFWKRCGAAFIDFLLIYIPLSLVLIYLTGISISIAMLSVGVWGALLWLYQVYFHYRWGATLGKLAYEIKVTLPDGSAIGLNQAVLRSSVEFGFFLTLVIVRIIAYSNADPGTYISAGWGERALYIKSFYPEWYGLVEAGKEVWYWSELIVLLFNKRNRAFHDFIAGTVVIQTKMAETHQDKKPSSILICPDCDYSINLEDFKHNQLFCPECGTRLKVEPQ